MGNTQAKNNTYVEGGAQKEVTSKGYTQTRIEVVVGDLVQEKADVLVNTIGTKAKLVAGSVSYAILEGGGKSLQEDITKHHPYGLKVGDIAQTSGGNLKCQKVFHVVLKPWVNVNDEAEQLLHRVVTECLQWASKQNFTSIAFPALGAGFHRFPGNRSADIVFRAIGSFEKDKKLKSLECVKIVIHPRDDLNKKDFLARRYGINVIHENYQSKTIILEKGDATKNEMKLHVVIGCLSQLKADALVNTTQTDLDLSVGAVSRSLLETGGQILQTECRKQCPAGLQYGGMVQTQGGNLKCQKVFHAVVPMWNDGKDQSEKGFKQVVMNCLQEASKHKFKSIGFPVLGTGYLEYPVKKSAALMLETITKFTKDNPTRSVRAVTIVVAHKDIDVRKVIECHIDGKGEDTSLEMTSFAGSLFVTGEKEALAGGKVKYLPLIPGDFQSNSPEEHLFNTIASHFFKNLEKDKVNRHIFEITKIEYVINPKHVKKFRSAQREMSKKEASYGEPVLAYHGTAGENIKSICEQGFRLPDHPDFKEENDVGWYGNGIYLSEYPRFSMNYMQKSQMLLICKVLQGKIFKCVGAKLGEPKEPGYDSHVDPFGKEIVIYDDDCILPCYIVYFNICKRFKHKDDDYDSHEEDDTNLEYLTEMEMHKGTETPTGLSFLV